MKRYIRFDSNYKTKYHILNDIFSMSFIQYNANSSGSSVGDCVCRAISIAFNVDYNEIRRYLNKYKKDLNAFSYKTISIYSHLIKELGGSSPISVDEEITVEQFVDSHNDNNAYLLEVGKTTERPNHLVACRRGNLFDSWDSSQRFVINYFIVPPSCFGEDLELSDIKDYLQEFAEKDIFESISKYSETLLNKWFKRYSGRNYLHFAAEGYRIKDYLVKIPLLFEFGLSDGTQRSWKFDAAYSFTPYMSYEQGLQFIDEKTKKRIYEKLYEIHKEIDEYEDEYAQIPEEDISEGTAYYGYGDKGKKFLQTLPAWVQLRCESVYVDKSRGGGYRDDRNYHLLCNPLPEDENREAVEFFGPTADCIKEEIKWYKKDFLRPGEDYGVDYDGIYEW